MIKGIAAVNNLGYIGKEGKMMWKSSEDFKHFKEKTMGGILIVGRKTFEIDLRGKGLPGRTTIVVGKNYNTPFQALEKANKIKESIISFINERNELIARNVDVSDIPEKIIPEIWVIGGLQIYNIFTPFVDEFHISNINDNQIGDVHFDINNIKCKIFNYNFEINQ